MLELLLNPSNPSKTLMHELARRGYLHPCSCATKCDAMGGIDAILWARSTEKEWFAIGFVVQW
jgi:hypothetical protein